MIQNVWSMGKKSFFIIIYNFGRFLSYPFFAWVSLSTQTGQKRIPERMLSSYLPVTVQWIRTLQITNNEKDYKLLQRTTECIHWNVISLTFLPPDRHNQFSNFGLFVEKSLKIFKSVSPPVLAEANFEFYREPSFPQSVSPIYLVQWARLTEKHIKAISSHLISEFCRVEDFTFFSPVQSYSLQQGRYIILSFFIGGQPVILHTVSQAIVQFWYLG